MVQDMAWLTTSGHREEWHSEGAPHGAADGWVAMVSGHSTGRHCGAHACDCVDCADCEMMICALLGCSTCCVGAAISFMVVGLSRKTLNCSWLVVGRAVKPSCRNV